MLLYLLLFIHQFLCAQEQLISQLTVTHNSVTIEPAKKFKKYIDQPVYAHYDYPGIDLRSLSYSTVIMPFLMNAMPLIWLSRKTWEIDEMDLDLHQSLLVVREVFKKIYPDIPWTGEVRAKKYVKTTWKIQHPNQFIMPFSGGLDSIHTSLRNKNKKQLLMLAREHEGYKDDEQWDAAVANARLFAQEFGHELCLVSSNYQRVIHPLYIFAKTPGFSSGTTHGLGWVGLIAPLAAALGYPLIKIASGFWWTYPMQKILCPMVDETIAFGVLKVDHDSFDKTRVDKIDEVLHACKNKKLPWRFYVCPQDKTGKNCNTCEKCLRTLAGLVVAGEKEFSAFGFDISYQELDPLILKMLSIWCDLYPWRIEYLQEKLAQKTSLERDDLLQAIQIATWRPVEPKRLDFYELAAFTAKIKNEMLVIDSKG